MKVVALQQVTAISSLREAVRFAGFLRPNAPELPRTPSRNPGLRYRTRRSTKNLQARVGLGCLASGGPSPTAWTRRRPRVLDGAVPTQSRGPRVTGGQVPWWMQGAGNGHGHRVRRGDPLAYEVRNVAKELFSLGLRSGVLTSVSVASPGASPVDWDSMFEGSAG